jgi:hypothetical protein
MLRLRKAALAQKKIRALQLKKISAWMRASAAMLAIQFVLPYMGFAFQNSPYRPSPALALATNNEHLELSGNLAKIDAAYQGSKRLIIHIHDLHCNYEAQSNIRKLLERLHKKYKISTVAIEGAARPVNVTKLRDFPDAEIKSEIVDYLVRQGKLSGAEAFAILSQTPIALEGIENYETYQHNLATVREFLNSESQGACLDIGNSLQELKDIVFSSRLKYLDDRRREYCQGRLNLPEYAKFLYRAAHRSGIAQNDLTHLLLFLRNQRNALGIAVDREELHQDIHCLEERLYETLIASEEESILHQWTVRLEIMGKLLAASATPDEVATFFKARAQFSAPALKRYLEARLGPDIGLPTEALNALDAYLAKVEDFYRVVDKRSSQFVSNTLSLMDQKHDEAVVLITGGFHNQGVQTALKASAVSFVSVIPQLKNEDLVNPYLQILQGRKLPLEQLMAKNQNLIATEPLSPQVPGGYGQFKIPSVAELKRLANEAGVSESTLRSTLRFLALSQSLFEHRLLGKLLQKFGAAFHPALFDMEKTSWPELGHIQPQAITLPADFMEKLNAGQLIIIENNGIPSTKTLVIKASAKVPAGFYKFGENSIYTVVADNQIAATVDQFGLKKSSIAILNLKDSKFIKPLLLFAADSWIGRWLRLVFSDIYLALLTIALIMATPFTTQHLLSLLGNIAAGLPGFAFVNKLLVSALSKFIALNIMVPKEFWIGSIFGMFGISSLVDYAQLREQVTKLSAKYQEWRSGANDNNLYQLQKAIHEYININPMISLANLLKFFSDQASISISDIVTLVKDDGKLQELLTPEQLSDYYSRLDRAELFEIQSEEDINSLLRVALNVFDSQWREAQKAAQIPVKEGLEQRAVRHFRYFLEDLAIYAGDAQRAQVIECLLSPEEIYTRLGQSRPEYFSNQLFPQTALEDFFLRWYYEGKINYAKRSADLAQETDRITQKLNNNDSAFLNSQLMNIARERNELNRSQALYDQLERKMPTELRQQFIYSWLHFKFYNKAFAAIEPQTLEFLGSDLVQSLIVTMLTQGYLQPNDLEREDFKALLAQTGIIESASDLVAQAIENWAHFWINQNSSLRVLNELMANKENADLYASALAKGIELIAKTRPEQLFLALFTSNIEKYQEIAAQLITIIQNPITLAHMPGYLAIGLIAPFAKAERSLPWLEQRMDRLKQILESLPLEDSKKFRIQVLVPALQNLLGQFQSNEDGMRKLLTERVVKELGAIKAEEILAKEIKNELFAQGSETILSSIIYQGMTSPAFIFPGLIYKALHDEKGPEFLLESILLLLGEHPDTVRVQSVFKSLEVLQRTAGLKPEAMQHRVATNWYYNLLSGTDLYFNPSYWNILDEALRNEVINGLAEQSVSVPSPDVLYQAIHARTDSDILAKIMLDFALVAHKKNLNLDFSGNGFPKIERAQLEQRIAAIDQSFKQFGLTLPLIGAMIFSSINTYYLVGGVLGLVALVWWLWLPLQAGRRVGNLGDSFTGKVLQVLGIQDHQVIFRTSDQSGLARVWENIWYSWFPGSKINGEMLEVILPDAVVINLQRRLTDQPLLHFSMSDQYLLGFARDRYENALYQQTKDTILQNLGKPLSGFFGWLSARLPFGMIAHPVTTTVALGAAVAGLGLGLALLLGAPLWIAIVLPLLAALGIALLLLPLAVLRNAQTNYLKGDQGISTAAVKIGQPIAGFFSSNAQNRIGLSKAWFLELVHYIDRHDVQQEIMAPIGLEALQQRLAQANQKGLALSFTEVRGLLDQVISSNKLKPALEQLIDSWDQSKSDTLTGEQKNELAGLVAGLLNYNNINIQGVSLGEIAEDAEPLVYLEMDSAFISTLNGMSPWLNQPTRQGDSFAVNLIKTIIQGAIPLVDGTTSMLRLTDIESKQLRTLAGQYFSQSRGAGFWSLGEDGNVPTAMATRGEVETRTQNGIQIPRQIMFWVRGDSGKSLAAEQWESQSVTPLELEDEATVYHPNVFQVALGGFFQTFANLTRDAFPMLAAGYQQLAYRADWKGTAAREFKRVMGSAVVPVWFNGAEGLLAQIEQDRSGGFESFQITMFQALCRIGGHARTQEDAQRVVRLIAALASGTQVKVGTWKNTNTEVRLPLKFIRATMMAGERGFWRDKAAIWINFTPENDLDQMYKRPDQLSTAMSA